MLFCFSLKVTILALREALGLRDHYFDAHAAAIRQIEKTSSTTVDKNNNLTCMSIDTDSSEFDATLALKRCVKLT